MPIAHFGHLILDAPRHGGEGGELVRGNLAVHARQVGQQRRLADRREAHEPDARVASLGHLKALLRRGAALCKIADLKYHFKIEDRKRFPVLSDIKSNQTSRSCYFYFHSAKLEIIFAPFVPK